MISRHLRMWDLDDLGTLKGRTEALPCQGTCSRAMAALRVSAKESSRQPSIRPVAFEIVDSSVDYRPGSTGRVGSLLALCCIMCCPYRLHQARKDLLKPSRSNRLGAVGSLWKPNTDFLPTASGPNGGGDMGRPHRGFHELLAKKEGNYFGHVLLGLKAGHHWAESLFNTEGVFLLEVGGVSIPLGKRREAMRSKKVAPPHRGWNAGKRC